MVARHSTSWFVGRPTRAHIKLCAGRTASEVNLSSLAGDAGVTHNTVEAWLSVLETGYLVTLIPAWHRNWRKQLVKRPKLHFLDTGLEREGTRIMVEAKSGATVHSELLRPLERLTALLERHQETQPTQRVLVYGGDEAHSRSTTTILPWSKIDRGPWISAE